MTPRPRAPIDSARRTAYDVVLAVAEDAAFANLLLPRLLTDRGLDARDAAFATELTYGALRWQGVLDEVIASAARRSVDDLDPSVRTVLRLGAYQLLHMRTAGHASVHTSVELVRAVAGERAVGLVNAVLRRVSEASWGDWVERLAPTDPLGRTAFRHGYPRWVAAAFLRALGDDVPELERALAVDRPTTHLVARPGRITRDELLGQVGPEGDAGPWSPYAVRLRGGAPTAVPAVRDGRAGVQDEGSQLAALALTRASVDGPERLWLDMCAGPGGKAALLGGLLPHGARLLAADLQEHRARLVARAVDPQAAVIVADATVPAWPPDSADRVLLDAPCTGLGALRRRPEVRWRRRAEDVARLHELQVQLLSSAVESARPGGVVGFVTCSPHPSETVAVVDRVLARRTYAVAIDARPCFPGVPELGEGPHVQLWPHRHGTDAMFVSLLRVRGPDDADGP